jgi:hypothetical protein
VIRQPRLPLQRELRAGRGPFLLGSFLSRAAPPGAPRLGVESVAAEYNELAWPKISLDCA